MTAPRPTIGRVVHYYPTQGEIDEGRFGLFPGEEPPLAADIVYVTNADTGLVSLHVKCLSADRPIRYLANVLFSETPRPGRWSWPPRV